MTLSLPIIPHPREITPGVGTVTINSSTAIRINDADPSLCYHRCARMISDKIQFMTGGTANPLKIENEPPTTPVEIILGIPYQFKMLRDALRESKLELELKTGDEGYLLHVGNNQILIAAETERGVFYGTQSFLQWLDTLHEPLEFSAVTIRDWPLMALRGLSDDISRGQISTLEDFKNIIRQLAEFKMNAYLPYIEDMFEWETYPWLGENRGRLTKSEVRELVAYAKDYFVDIIPVFECLGHQDRMLKYSENLKLAERPDNPWSFFPGNEETYLFLDHCIRELVEVFPSSNFCIGCDETADLGHHRSKALASEIGIDGVFAQHVRRVRQILNKYGKTCWMYGDMLFESAYPDLKDKLPKDIVMVNWDYIPRENYDRVDSFNQWGFKQIVSPGVHCWGRIFPDIEEALSNLKLVRQGYKKGALGMIQSAWADFGGESLRESNLYLYALSAETGWNPDRDIPDHWDTHFAQVFYGAKDSTPVQLTHLLGDLNHDFKFYYATTAISIWRDGFNEQCTKLITDRDKLASRLMEQYHLGESLLAKADQAVTRHQDHLDIFQMTLLRARLLSERILYIPRKEKLDQLLSDTSINTEVCNRELAAFIHSLREQQHLLQRIKNDFEHLWLRYNKRPLVDVLLVEYDRLFDWLESIIIEYQNKKK